MAEEHRSPSDVPGDFAHWGRQTIAFAMSVHASDLGKPFENPERVRQAGDEAVKIAQELWAEAHSECAEPVRFEDITIPFTRKILAWAADHLGYSLPS